MVGPGEAIEASVAITNTGEREGSTVMQFYIGDEDASVARPLKELAGFAKIRLAPGETRRVSAKFDMRSLAFFDIESKSWVAEAGRFSLLAGFSSADVVARASFTLSETWIDDSPRRASVIRPLP